MKVTSSPTRLASPFRIMLTTVRWLSLLTLLAIACAPPGHLDQNPQAIKLNPGWEATAAYHGPLRTGRVTAFSGLAIIEGDPSLISGDAPNYGLVLSAERNDPAAITQRYAEQFADFAGTLIVFTHFEDQASRAPSYFLSIYNDVTGTGMGDIDRRAAFGVERIEGFINMRRVDDHANELMKRLVHEVAHRHLAYMKVQIPSSTLAFDLTGREGGHWHAAFNSQGSVMEGYGWRQSGDDRFVSISKQTQLAPIDLYGLGVLEGGRLDSLFFISGARVTSGAILPPGADLPIGTVVTGTKTEFSVDDLINTMGPRPLQPRLQVAFVLLTVPGESSTSTQVQATATRIEALRLELEEEWRTQTQGRGTLQTKNPVTQTSPDGGFTPASPAPDTDACACQNLRHNCTPVVNSVWLGFLVLSLCAARLRAEIV